MKELMIQRQRISLPFAGNKAEVLETVTKAKTPRSERGDEIGSRSEGELLAQQSSKSLETTTLDGDVGGKKPASKTGPMLWRPQNQLSEDAWTAFDRADHQLEIVTIALSRELYGHEHTRLTNAAEGFKRQRDVVSRLKAKAEGGGSAGELVRASVAEEMTYVRVAELEQRLAGVARNFRESILLELVLRQKVHSEPAPKLVSVWGDVTKALNRFGPYEGEHESMAMSAEKVRSALTELAYFQWKHPTLDEESRAEMLAGLRTFRSEGDALLVELWNTPNLGGEAKELYAILLDGLDTVDGMITRLEHGKAP